MKQKGLKKVVSVLLVCAMVVGASIAAFAAEEGLVQDKTYTNAAQMAQFTFKGYNNGTLPSPTTMTGLMQYTMDVFDMGEDYNGPIGIVEANLNKDGKDTPVYVVALSGTELIWSQYTGLQSTGAITDLLCGFNLSNPYINAVRTTMLNNIPKNANIVFYGHSLGGMIAQEAAADSKIKKNYNVLNTITFGSPLIKLLSGREGTVRRLCDDSDIVPILSVYSLTPLAIFQYWGSERMAEDGGFDGDWLAAHNSSYLSEDIWGAYDVLGMKNGSATLTFNYKEAKYYDAPAISWLKLK